MNEARAPRYQVSVVMNGRDQIDVRRMQRRGVRIIEQKQIALADLALEFADDRLAGLRCAREVMQEPHSAHQQ